MDIKQAKAREFIDADLQDAIGMIDDVVKIVPNAGLGPSPKLDNELSKARAQLTAIRKLVADLAKMVET